MSRACLGKSSSFVWNNGTIGKNTGHFSHQGRPRARALRLPARAAASARVHQDGARLHEGPPACPARGARKHKDAKGIRRWLRPAAKTDLLPGCQSGRQASTPSVCYTLGGTWALYLAFFFALCRASNLNTMAKRCKGSCRGSVAVEVAPGDGVHYHRAATEYAAGAIR